MLTTTRRSLLARLLLSIAALVVLAPSLALAQSTGRIRGVVSDAQGAVVPGATILVRNQATSEERTTVSDKQGEFLVPALPVGLYRIEVRLQGFQSKVVTDLRLEVAQTVVQNVHAGARQPLGGSVGGGPDACHRDGHHLGRPGDRLEDGAGDAAQRPALRGPRAADSRLGGAAAERLPDGAAARPGIVRLQHGGQPRGHRQLHDQRHQPERHGAEPDHVPAVDQHRAGVQGGQLRR